MVTKDKSKNSRDMKRYGLLICLALLTCMGFAQTKSIQVMETVKVNV